MKSQLILISILSVISFSCKKPKVEPPKPIAPKVDPCEGKTPVTADFEIADAHWVTNGNFHPADNVTPGHIRLTANELDADYIWEIEGVKYYDQKLVLETYYELNKRIGDTISAKLIVSKEPDSLCFPTDNGKDTVIKTFRIIDGCQTQILGTYRGVLENETDSFDISFQLIVDSFGDSCSTLTITHPRAGNGYCEQLVGQYKITDRSLRTGQTTTSCFSLVGKATYSFEGIFEFKYTLDLEDEPEYVFRGRKIE